jgi:hypothetical protein
VETNCGNLTADGCSPRHWLGRTPSASTCRRSRSRTVVASAVRSTRPPARGRRHVPSRPVRQRCRDRRGRPGRTAPSDHRGGSDLVAWLRVTEASRRRGPITAMRPTLPVSWSSADAARDRCRWSTVRRRWGTPAVSDLSWRTRSPRRLLNRCRPCRNGSGARCSEMSIRKGSTSTASSPCPSSIASATRSSSQPLRSCWTWPAVVVVRACGWLRTATRDSSVSTSPKPPSPRPGHAPNGRGSGTGRHSTSVRSRIPD